jgi:hypothetical protein
VVGGVAANFEGAVDLFEQDEARHLVGEGERGEADEVGCPGAEWGREPFGAANHKGEATPLSREFFLDKGGKALAGKALASRIEGDIIPLFLNPQREFGVRF